MSESNEVARTSDRSGTPESPFNASLEDERQGATVTGSQGTRPAENPFANDPATDALRASWSFELARAVEGPLKVRDFAGALSAATVLLEDRLRAVSDPPREKAIRGGKDLAVHALGLPDGVLVQHLSKSEADGIRMLVEGAFQFVRNRAHHNARINLPPWEVTWAIDAINYLIGVVQRLAVETYLQPYLSQIEYRRLLQVKHVDLDGDGTPERIVTYSRQVPSDQQGRVLITKRNGDRWDIVPGRPTTQTFCLDGNIIEGLRDCDTEAPLCVVTFGVMLNGTTAHEAVVFGLQAGQVAEYSGPVESKFSWLFEPEVRDQLCLGIPQLISYSRSAAGGGQRRFWLAKSQQLMETSAPEELGLTGFRFPPSPPVPHSVIRDAEVNTAADGDGPPDPAVDAPLTPQT